MQQSLATLTPVLWQPRNIAVQIRDIAGRASSIGLDKPFARIGSHPEADAVLPAADVGTRGLYLHGAESGIYCLSLEPASAGKSFPNGWLRPKIHARLGPYRVNAAFLDEGPEPHTDLPDLRQAGNVGEDAPWLRIELAGGGGPVLQQPLKRRLTLVGSRPPSKVLLDHPSVTGSHCVLYWDGAELWVVDLNSDEGVYLNGQWVEAAKAPLGSVLDLGAVRLTRIAVQEAQATTVSVAESPFAAEDSACDSLGTNIQSVAAPRFEPMPSASIDIPIVSLESEPPAPTVDEQQFAEQFAALEAELQAARDQQAKLERARAALENELTALRKSVEEAAAADAQELEDRYVEWREMHSRMALEVAQAQADRDAALELAQSEENQRAALVEQSAAELAELRQSLEAEKKAHAEVRTALAELTSRFDALGAEMAGVAAELSAVAIARDQAFSERDALTGDRDRLRVAQEAAAADLSRAMAELDSLRASMASDGSALQAEIAALTSSRQQARQDAEMAARQAANSSAERDAALGKLEEFTKRHQDLLERHAIERAETLARHEAELAAVREQAAESRRAQNDAAAQIELLSNELTIRTEEANRDRQVWETRCAAEATDWQSRWEQVVAERDAALERAGRTVALAEPPAPLIEESSPFKALKQRHEALEKNYSQLLANRDDLIAKLNAFSAKIVEAERERDQAKLRAETAERAAEAVRQRAKLAESDATEGPAPAEPAEFQAEKKSWKRQLNEAHNTERTLRKQVADLEQTLATVRERTRFFEATVRELRAAQAAPPPDRGPPPKFRR